MRHGLQEQALTLVPRKVRRSDSYGAIRDLASGQNNRPRVFGRIIPGADGLAVSHWDMVIEKKDDKRPRFAFGDDAFRSILHVIVEKADGKPQEIIIENARPCGWRSLPTMFSDCRGVRVFLKGEEPEPGARDQKPAPVIAFGLNILAEELDKRGQDAESYDPCWRTITKQVSIDTAEHCIVSLAPPQPLDQVMQYQCEIWIGVDHDRFPDAAAQLEIDCFLAYILLDADKNPLPDPNLVIGTGARLEPGGAWSLFSQSDLKKKLPVWSRVRRLGAASAPNTRTENQNGGSTL